MNLKIGKNRKIFFRLHFHHEGVEYQKNYFGTFFSVSSALSSCKISGLIFFKKVTNEVQLIVKHWFITISITITITSRITRVKIRFIFPTMTGKNKQLISNHPLFLSGKNFISSLLKISQGGFFFLKNWEKWRILCCGYIQWKTCVGRRTNR